MGGDEEGASVGDVELGVIVGSILGIFNGTSVVGNCEGTKVAEGDMDGSFDGAFVGEKEDGVTLKVTLGNAYGTNVGPVVGNMDGLIEGR